MADVEIFGAQTHGETVSMETGLIVEGPNRLQKPAMGTYYWDASDPMVIALHFEVFMSAVIIDEERYRPPVGVVPDGDEAVPCCIECDAEIPFETFGCLSPTDKPDHYLLLCLGCGHEKPEAVCEESLWVFGLAELEGVLADAPPAPAGAAQARVWRWTQEHYQIAIHSPHDVHILTLDIEDLETMLGAIREWYQIHGGEEIIVDDYLAGGVAALERHANNKGKPKHKK